MTKIEYGVFNAPGGREIYEDRVDAKEVKTKGGLVLSVAVVADGVGGEAKGERAAQLGMDSVFEYIESSEETNIPKLLSLAAADANRKVHAEYEMNEGASSTLAVAVVDSNQTTYVANVGDSRVYLCRGDRLTQLTKDHTFAQVMVWQGKMSAEVAAKNPRAEAIMRALGPRPNIPVDIGFYVGDDNYDQAQQRGLRGIPLQEGDSILVCSDGLIKDSPSGVPYAKDDEISRILKTQRGEDAAKMLVSTALGRNADDNVSVAVLQMPNPALKAAAFRKRLIYGALGLVGLIAMLSVVFLIGRSGNDGEISEAQAMTLTAIAQAQLDSDATIQALQAQLEAGGDDDGEISAQLTAEAERAADLEAQSTQQAEISTTVADSVVVEGDSADCRQPDNFTFTTFDPVLDPPRGSQIAAGSLPSVAYPIVVTGACPIRVGQLISVKGGQDRLATLLDESGVAVDSLGNGERGVIRIMFDSAAEVQEFDDEWRITVIDEDNFPVEFTPDQEPPTLKLFVNDALGEGWLVQDVEAPAATPVPATSESSANNNSNNNNSNQVNTQATQTANAQIVNARNAQATQTAQAQAANARNFQATQTADAQAQAANARNAQATQTANAQAANARNFQATQTANAQAANARNAQATQTAQAQAANARNAQATQTANARNAQATQTAQAQAANARNAQATQTAQAQAANARNAQATQTAAAASWSATQTAQAVPPTVNVPPTNTPPPPPPASPTPPEFPCGDVRGNPAADFDNDGKPNGVELNDGLDPCNPDTDGDGVPDGIDIGPLDPSRPGSDDGGRG